MKQDINSIKAAFVQRFANQPQSAFFAPGRVNLIGEHTDYNGGYVFPCALSFGVTLMMSPNRLNQLRFRSMNMDEELNLPLSALTNSLPNRHWVNYPLGCIAQLVRSGYTLSSGYDLLYSGDVPAGAGLSSSAAIEVVTAFAFNELLHSEYSLTEIAKIGQLSEHEFAGVHCGIMDQFASAHAQTNHAIYLNCSTLEYEMVPIRMEGYKLVIANTHSPHKLDSGVYNQRVEECKEAVRLLKQEFPLQCLADMTMADFQNYRYLLTNDVISRRALHVVSENERTREAVEALCKNHLSRFGQLMTESHISLRDNYEVTGPELDALAEAAWQITGVLGSRMTGGGFGGCTVSVVNDDAVSTFIEEVGRRYHTATGLTADFYVAEVGDGVHRLF